MLNGKRPDFQEFLLIPDSNSVEKAFEMNKKAKEKAEEFLRRKDSDFKGNKNDENAWITSLNEKEIFDIMNKLNIPIGTDIASSGYIANLIKNYDLLYIEDPFSEEDFEGFSKLLKKFPNSLIVGDDLTVTNSKRLKKAIEMKAINAIIIKPNQCGSLLEVKKVAELAKENGIKIVFSHRSGETNDDSLAHLAVGWECPMIKTGIVGGERVSKINELLAINEYRKSI